ncbi:MAG: NAD(P)/FAD-dependent oxidoreductase [Gammaproteobacteria bacterium]|nr:NAD(P)/FAD-dependent oxidoreductase [Gammaproteobacteria bacterium]
MSVMDSDVTVPGGLDHQGPPLVVVGTDVAALAVIEELRLRGYGGRIQLFGDRPYGAAEQERLAQVRRRTALEYHEVPILTVDRRRQAVTDMAGRSHLYQTLILATGCRPRVPGIPGVGSAGVHLFYQLEQLPGLLERLDPSLPVAVVGGGLLGMTAAAALAEHGFASVQLVQQESRLMHSRLDDNGAAILHEIIEKNGINVLMDAGVVAIESDHGRVTAVRLRDGSAIEVSQVILATGIRPNTQLARDAQLRTGHGVLVDDQLRTSVAGIHALGACAEHRGVVHGLVGPGLEQAAVLAALLMGESAQYVGSMSVNQRDIAGVAVFSHGSVAELRRSPFITTREYRDSAKQIYRRVVLERGVLIGALAIGPLPERARLEEAINNGRRLSLWQQLQFRLTGSIWSKRQLLLHQAPPATVVCRCTGATVKMLRANDGVADRAGSVCGACRNQLPDRLPVVSS